MNIKLFFQATIKFILGVFIVGILIFLPANTLNYWNGWLLMSLLFIPMLCAGIVLMIKNRLNSVYEDKLENLFIGMLNKRIGQTIIKSAGFQLSDSASNLNEKEIRAIVSKIKKFQLEVTGVRGFEYAQVTGGGIELNRFNCETMQSTLCKGLYACGEVLDVTGDCGGFNLQWAWTSGYKAGLSAAKSIKR